MKNTDNVDVMRVYYDTARRMVIDIADALPSFSGAGAGSSWDMDDDGVVDFNDVVDLINPLPFSAPFNTMEQLMDPYHSTGGIPIS